MALQLQQPMPMATALITSQQHGLLRLPPQPLKQRQQQRRRLRQGIVIVAVLKNKPTPSTSSSSTSSNRNRNRNKSIDSIETGGEGIFGTSGRIGFTKENELFVGRVAMLGFAASLLGEAVTGKGILAQLKLETGIPIYRAEPLLLFFILFTLLGAIGALGGRGRFVDEATGIERAVIKPGKGVRGALGLNKGGPLFGFTKANELFVGRVAQLGIAFSLIGEIITGKGALAQLNIETGVPVNEIEPLLLFSILFFFFAAINPGTGEFVTDEDTEN